MRLRQRFVPAGGPLRTLATHLVARALVKLSERSEARPRGSDLSRRRRDTRGRARAKRRFE